MKHTERRDRQGGFVSLDALIVYFLGSETGSPLNANYCALLPTPTKKEASSSTSLLYCLICNDNTLVERSCHRPVNTRDNERAEAICTERETNNETDRQ